MQPEKTHEPIVIKACDEVIGKKVANFQGVELGEIKELMIDAAAGRVTYAILSFGGFLGLGDKLFAVPWVSLNYEPAHNRFVMKADKELLTNAPGFAKNHWPNMSDATWQSALNKYYNAQL